MSTNKLHRRRGVWHTPEVRKLCYVMAAGCCMVRAVVYRAYAIRPYNSRKTEIAHPFQSSPKTTFDVIRLC